MDFIKWVKSLWKGKKGDSYKELKDKTYYSKNKFSSDELRRKNFKRSKEKLFDVNRWSKLPELSAGFQMYNEQGEKTDELRMNNFINIDLPALSLENWVIVTNIREEEGLAEFTVSPSNEPTAKEKSDHQIQHFFIDEASSTFRVTLKDKWIYAYEIGKNEAINNEGISAGKRKVINTIIAKGAWAGFQKLQWKKLTNFLCHHSEIE